MAISKLTMTDEQRKSVALEYLKAFDNGGKTSTGGSILDLFAEDAQVCFPKWGLANGKEQIGHPVRERHSGGAAGGGEERTLRQELAHDPPARGSQRKADRYLLLSRARPDDQQAREIGAGDEQHHADRRH